MLVTHASAEKNGTHHVCASSPNSHLPPPSHPPAHLLHRAWSRAGRRSTSTRPRLVSPCYISRPRMAIPTWWPGCWRWALMSIPSRLLAIPPSTGPASRYTHPTPSLHIHIQSTYTISYTQILSAVRCKPPSTQLHLETHSNRRVTRRSLAC